MSTDWYSGGQARNVTTTRNQGESVADWKARHKAAVADAMTTFPPE